MEEDSPGRVGYRRPPAHSRFKPGESGNPKGRPKKAKDFGAEFLEELDEPVVFQEHGRDLKISKRRAIVKTVVAAAMKGDARSIASLLTFSARGQARNEMPDYSTEPADDDAGRVERFLAKELKKDPTAKSESDLSNPKGKGNNQ